MVEDSLQCGRATYCKVQAGELWWEPEMMRRSFSALLRCRVDRCGEVIAFGGDFVPFEDLDFEMNQRNYNELVSPKFFTQ
jgi:hypothetical protein